MGTITLDPGIVTATDAFATLNLDALSGPFVSPPSPSSSPSCSVTLEKMTVIFEVGVDYWNYVCYVSRKLPPTRNLKFGVVGAAEFRM